MKEQIIASDLKKHVKIYRLSLLGLSKKEIADALQTNTGHVYNVLKEYGEDISKATAAQQIAI